MKNMFDTSAFNLRSPSYFINFTPAKSQERSMNISFPKFMEPYSSTSANRYIRLGVVHAGEVYETPSPVKKNISDFEFANNYNPTHKSTKEKPKLNHFTYPGNLETTLKKPKNNIFEKPRKPIKEDAEDPYSKHTLHIKFDQNDFDSESSQIGEESFKQEEIDHELKLFFGTSKLSKDNYLGKRATSTLESSSKKFFMFSTLLNYSQSEKLSLARRNSKRYVCKYCGNVFHSGCALGGHVSKIHRGVNIGYTKRKLKRRENKIERERTKYINEMFTEN